MSKKLITLAASFFLVFILVACAGTPAPAAPEPPAAEGEQPPVAEQEPEQSLGLIGFSISTLSNPFFVTMEQGARSMAEQLGVDITITDAADNVATQMSDVEDLLTAGIDVLLINPVDSATAALIVNDALDAGIPVIAVGRAVDGADIDTFIYVNNIAAALYATEFFIDAIGEGASVAVLEGVPGASSAIDRLDGFMQAAEGRLEIATSLTANFNRVEGLNVTENILQAHPDIVGIFAMNDEMGLGAIEAALAAGRQPGEDIFITGFDATADALAAVQAGTMLYTVDQMSGLQGATAVELAVDFMLGNGLPSLVPVDVQIIAN